MLYSRQHILYGNMQEIITFNMKSFRKSSKKSLVKKLKVAITFLRRLHKQKEKTKMDML